MHQLTFRKIVICNSPDFSNPLILLFYILFSIFNFKKCLEAWVNCVWNCVMPLCIPLEVKFSKKYLFLQKCTPPSSEMRNLFQRWHLKDIKDKNHGFEKSRALKTQFYKKWVSALHFRENGLAIIFYMANGAFICTRQEMQFVPYVGSFTSTPKLFFLLLLLLLLRLTKPVIKQTSFTQTSSTDDFRWRLV